MIRAESCDSGVRVSDPEPCWELAATAPSDGAEPHLATSRPLVIIGCLVCIVREVHCISDPTYVLGIEQVTRTSLPLEETSLRGSEFIRKGVTVAHCRNQQKRTLLCVKVTETILYHKASNKSYI